MTKRWIILTDTALSLSLAACGTPGQAGGDGGADDGREIKVSENDDAGDPAKAVSAATTLIGQGSDIIAGSTSSGVALQVASLAKDNETLFISGPAATDGITGLNEYTFRSGRQTYQDVATAGTMLVGRRGQPMSRKECTLAPRALRRSARSS